MSSCNVDNLLENIIQTSVTTAHANNSMSYQQEVLKTVEMGSYCSILHMYAAANAFGYRIRSIFPIVSNVAISRNILNQTIHPLGPHNDQPISIMWTHTSNADPNLWSPNHFVPCVDNVEFNESYAKKRRTNDHQQTQSQSQKATKPTDEDDSMDGTAEEMYENKPPDNEKQDKTDTGSSQNVPEQKDKENTDQNRNPPDSEKQNTKDKDPNVQDTPEDKYNTENTKESGKQTRPQQTETTQNSDQMGSQPRDVGYILNGTVSRTTLSDYEKCQYLTNHFDPEPGYQKFVTQTVTRGKNKETKKLVFQSSWLQKYGWLVYSPVAEGGLCKFCVVFSNENDKRKYHGTFVTRPFTNLVKATGKDGALEKHTNLQYHKDSVQMGLDLKRAVQCPKEAVNVKLSAQMQETYEKNLHTCILQSIVKAVILCGKQNLPLRGHRDDQTSTKSNKGTFLAVLDLLAEHDAVLKEHLDTGKRMQNIHQRQSKMKLSSRSQRSSE